jgi:hypothetical protein
MRPAGILTSSTCCSDFPLYTDRASQERTSRNSAKLRLLHLYRLVISDSALRLRCTSIATSPDVLVVANSILGETSDNVALDTFERVQPTVHAL